MRVTDVENLAAAVARGEPVDSDDALELLEDEALTDEVAAAGASWALFTLSTLSDDSALWRSTLVLLALRIDASSGPSIELGALYRRAGDLARAAKTLVAALPATPAQRRQWATLAASWAREGAGVAELASACDEAARACLLASDAWDDELLAVLDITAPETPSMVTMAARARLRAISGDGQWRVRVAGDGRWVGAGSAMVRSDGLLERIEDIDAPRADTIVGMVAGIGGGPTSAVRRRVEPALEVIEVWQPVVAVRSRLLVVGAGLGIDRAILDAASDLAGDLDEVELGLIIDAGGEIRRELGLRGRAGSLAEAPWVRGSHLHFIGAPVRVRALVGRSVSLAIEADIEDLPAALPPPPAPPPGRGATVLCADLGELLASWPPRLATEFRGAVIAADPAPLPGASGLERRAHARAIAARFESGADLGLG